MGDKQVAYLYMDMLVARILGKRVCEPEFFRLMLLRSTQSLSTNLEDVRHWAKGTQVKCRAACLHQNQPKLLLVVSPDFRKRHRVYYDLLVRASNLRGSRWRVADTNKPVARKKDAVQVKEVRHLVDVDALVGNVPMLDRLGGGPQVSTLDGVLLRRAKTTEADLASGGA